MPRTIVRAGSRPSASHGGAIETEDYAALTFNDFLGLAEDALADAGFRAVAPFSRGYAPTDVPADGRYQTGALARDANASGDRVLGENYLQHAEHYFRLLRAMQPTRPASEILGRDHFSSGFDIDFEDETGDSTLARAATEAMRVALAQSAPTVQIPAGEFTVGSKRIDDDPYGLWTQFDDTELPQQRVWLDAYAIDRHEVSLAEYLSHLRQINQHPADELQKLIWHVITVHSVSDHTLARWPAASKR